MSNPYPTAEPQLAPALEAAQWFNTTEPISLDQLRGQVVVIEAFQILCPGCVAQGLPQAVRVRETFHQRDVTVLGLHSVFEHHDAQTPTSLEAFLHEYRIGFPVAVDAPGMTSGLPRTMAAYRMGGTPTLILIDRRGQLRAQYFGHVSDLTLGAEIMSLIAEAGDGLPATDSEGDGPAKGCDHDGCAVELDNEGSQA